MQVYDVDGAGIFLEGRRLIFIIPRSFDFLL